MDFLTRVPNPALIGFCFALAWLGCVLAVEALKNAKGQRAKAAWGLMIHVGFWALGMIFVLENVDRFWPRGF